VSDSAGPRGRSTGRNPAGRFERLRFEAEAPPPESVETHFLRDDSRSVLSRNDSPDVPFTYSVNPYRGCEHGCVYCYARPTHEYLGFSAGLDFESRILVKERAPELLRAELGRPGWKPQVVALSGVTDPYQPVERRLEITRGCLEVLLEARNPVGVITKNRLVTRDLDLLADLARHGAAAVTLSITTLDVELVRRMEPRTSAPRDRIEALRLLAAAGIPCGVMIAPVIPGLNDHEIPAILRAAAAAGARYAGYLLLRLPGAVATLFEGWLADRYPERRSKVMGRIRQVRGGGVNDSRFGRRMRGAGPYADGVASLFASAIEASGLARRGPELSTAAFRRPGEAQLGLFDGGR
jgi:DNA repair photolyase